MFHLSNNTNIGGLEIFTKYKIESCIEKLLIIDIILLWQWFKSGNHI